MRIIAKAPTEWMIACPQCAATIGYVAADVRTVFSLCDEPVIVCPSCKNYIAVPGTPGRRKAVTENPQHE